MTRLIKFLVYTNIFVAFSAFCLYKITEIIFEFHNPLIGAFIFFSTLFCYNYMRVFNFLKFKNRNEMPLWVYNNRVINYTMMLISGLLSIYLVYFLGVFFSLLILPAVIISLLYQLPIQLNSKSYCIRSIPLGKIFIISFVWSYITVLVPILHEKYSIDYMVVDFFFQRIFFVIAISIPFDMRDLKVDDIKTIPNRFGIYNSKLFGWFCLLIVQVLLIIDVITNKISLSVFIALFISIELTSLILYFSNQNRSFFFYGIIVEGLSIIMCLFVLISQVV